MSEHKMPDTDPLFQMIGAVAPALVPYTRDRIVGELWGRPGLGARERSIVTLSILVSSNAAGGYVHYLNKALDNAVAPGELSELLTHLAFYTGFAYAFGAAGVLKSIFEERGIGIDQLPAVAPSLLSPLDVFSGEPAHTAFLQTQVAPASEALRHFTDALLYGEVWRRPGLSTRDRRLATIATFAARGETTLLPEQLAGALESGVTRVEMGELLAHVAFYGGWGKAMQAASVVTGFYGWHRG